MIKERLHHYILGTVVGLSILSFVYVNFFSANADCCGVRNELVNRTEQAATVDKDEVDTEKGSGPDIAVLVRVFDFVKKFVPANR